MNIVNEEISFNSNESLSKFEHLAQIIKREVLEQEDCTTLIPDLTFFQRTQLSNPIFCMVEPSIVFVVQGAKQLLVGKDTYLYNRSNFLITSLDLPAKSEVIDANPEHPCLGFTLKIDLIMLGELIAQGNIPFPQERNTNKSVGIGTVTQNLLEPFMRLLNLLEEPNAIPVISPLILKEIHYRLLMSDQAQLLRQIISIDNQGYRIAKAIDWLKSNYTTSFRIEELASRVQMSIPTFHHHFRQLTSMSPLQYQKWLRLNEARRLMLNDHLDASSAAFQVGYESSSQFSREYSRLFGVPPKKDVEILKGNLKK